MCGIAGVVGAFDPARAYRTVQRMTDALGRRGPDGSGIECWDRAVLGHRRLAIFDLSEAGHQPMLSGDRTVGVVFNGAIYNFHALRAELERCGWRFRSGTDTEVLVHGYREWGIDELVRRLRGMFALGVWDERAGRLYLVRDRLGVKPLVYATLPGVLAFASTVRGLRAGGLVSELDPRAVGEFLEFGFVTEDRSIYEGAVKVPPASIIEWSADSGAPRTTMRTYWTPPRPGSAGEVTFADAVEETERLLLRAVEMRLHADVPVGALLSSGIDSSLVCWAVAKLGGDVTAFTVGTPGHPTDETEDARLTAHELGITLRVLDLSRTHPAEVQDLVSAYAEPFAVQSALGMLRVSEAVATSAKVLLTGDGGDDVFLGYPRHRHLLLAQSIARRMPPELARRWYSWRRILPSAGPLRRTCHFLDYATGGLGAFIDAAEGLPAYQRYGILGERLHDVRVLQRETPWSPAAARRALLDYLEYDRHTQFVSEYLTKVDGATMHFSLEARSPFFDQELWEFAAALPLETRLYRLRLKAVLRALARRRISARVARGRKRGFMIPVRRWIADRWRSTVGSHLQTGLLAAQGWIRPGAVVDMLRATPRGTEAPLPLWYLFVLEEWLRYEQAIDTASPEIERRPLVGVIGRASDWPIPSAARGEH